MTASNNPRLDRLIPQIGDLCLPCFQRVTLSCQRKFQVPLAVIGLRENRHLRLYYSSAMQQRMLLDDALCGLPLAIPGEQILIEDLETMPEDMKPHLALALGLRSYAGVPIFLRGELTGSLSLADHRPRQFIAREIKQLKDLANWTGKLLELYL